MSLEAWVWNIEASLGNCSCKTRADAHGVLDTLAEKLMQLRAIGKRRRKSLIADVASCMRLATEVCLYANAPMSDELDLSQDLGKVLSELDSSVLIDRILSSSAALIEVLESSVNGYLLDGDDFGEVLRESMILVFCLMLNIGTNTGTPPEEVLSLACQQS